MADIESFLKKSEVSAEIQYCDPKRSSIVDLDFPESRIQFKLKPNEVVAMNKNFIAQLSRCKKKEFVQVPRDRVSELKTCNSRVIVPTIDSYQLKVGGPGGKQGEITTTLHIFANGSASSPEKRITASAVGEPWWGENKPLEYALDVVATKLCEDKNW